MAVALGDLRYHYPNSEGAADGDALATLAVDSATNTAAEKSIVDSELTESDDYWTGAILRGITGNLAGVWAHVTDFVAGTDKLYFPYQFTATPANGNTYNLILPKTNAYRAALEIPGKTITALSNVTGFTVEYVAYGNADSTTAELNFKYNGGSAQGLTWDQDGSSEGAEIDISGLSENEEVYLTSDELGAYIRVKRTGAALPGSDKTDVLTVSMPENRIIPTCSGAETTAGRVYYAQVFLLNAHATDTIPLLAASCLPRVAAAAETTIDTGGGIVIDADDVLTAVSLANWPTSGWVYHSTGGTIDDVRFYWGKSGESINVLDPDGGMRDFTAAAWGNGEAIGLYSDVDIAITALSSDQFPDPSGLSYSAPLSVDDALAIGDLAAGVSYGLAIRETVPATQWPRADLLSSIIISCNVLTA